MASVRFNRWAAGVRVALVVAAALMGPLGGGGDVRAQTASGDAVAKARFAITVARFVQWPGAAPAGDAATLKICAMHNSPSLGAAFAGLEGQRVAGRAVKVLQNPRAPDGCGLLFVDNSVSHGSAAALAAAASQPMLTLGAVDGFLSQGGMVELANVNDTLRFDVNLKALRAARLDLSSQVLGLARQVRH